MLAVKFSALYNCWVVKTLMSSYILCKFSGFSKKISPKLFAISGSNFQRELKLLFSFNIQRFNSLASSDNDKHMIMKQNM